jgi:hypothetical protein
MVADVAEEESQRPRDAQGRFLPKDEDEQDDAATAQAADGDHSDDKDTETVDASDTVAPSIGPHTTIERKPPGERLNQDEISQVDAMGLDKRREVMGQRYSPSFAKQATLYGVFLVVLAALVIGGKLLADKLDEPPATVADEAAWSSPDAPQRPPPPLQ